MRNISPVCPLGVSELRSLSDEQLMACMCTGHHDALDILFQRYHRLVLSIALKILRHADEAEDVMQEVFLKLFEEMAQFNAEKGSTKVWIMQFAYHRSLSRRRKLSLRNHYPLVELEEIADVIPEMRTSGLTVQESKRLARQALDSLNAEQRRTIELAYYEGLSMKEIAAKTGESLVNVRHHYYRGLNKLRGLLWQEERMVATPPREAIDAKA